MWVCLFSLVLFVGFTYIIWLKITTLVKEDYINELVIFVTKLPLQHAPFCAYPYPKEKCKCGVTEIILEKERLLKTTIF